MRELEISEFDFWCHYHFGQVKVSTPSSLIYKAMMVTLVLWEFFELSKTASVEGLAEWQEQVFLISDILILSILILHVKF